MFFPDEEVAAEAEAFVFFGRLRADARCFTDPPLLFAFCWLFVFYFLRLARRQGQGGQVYIAESVFVISDDNPLDF